MKTLFNIFVIILIIIFTPSCEDKPVIPSLTTTLATEISTTTAVSGGSITNDGGAQIVTVGVCWNTTNDPTTENNRTIESGDFSSFTCNVTQLSPNTAYYLRAYATNSAGTGYGKMVSFKTLGDKPSSSNLITSNITINSAKLSSSVNANLLSTTVTFEYGVTTSYGSTAAVPQNPVTGNSDVNVTTNLTGLTPGTTYHFRIKTENSLGITYSSDMTFTTLGKVPDVTILAATNLQIKTATLSGSVNPNYLSSTVTFEWGTTTSYGNSITSEQSLVTGSTAVDVSTNLTGLTPGTTYHFRIKATNELGTSNSNDLTFTTNGSVPTTTIKAATNIQVYSATVNGLVNPNYLSSTIEFEWGLTSSYGNKTIPMQSPVSGSTSTDVSANLSGLTPKTTYHFRINASNELGTTNSNDLTFVTLGDIPSSKVESAKNLQYNSATLSGSVNPNYFTTTVIFEYGTTSSYGNTYSFLQGPISGNSLINVSADLSGLTQGTIYHIRIHATNELGTTYSEDYTFTTLAPVSDIENNVYNIRTIGKQIWMTENLKTTKFNNGDNISTTSPSTLDISGQSNPIYQWAYNDDVNFVPIYGRLYTGYVATDTRNVCPIGWHVPTDAEWTILTDYLTNNGYGFGGNGNDIAKSMASSTLWNSAPVEGNVGNDIASNNRSGFTANPAGMRINNQDVDAEFISIGYHCSFWSSTHLTQAIAWQRILFYTDNNVIRSYNGWKKSAVSIRCLKN